MLGLRRSVSGFITEQKSAAAKRGLENELLRIVNLVEGHKTQGLPPGHLYYKLLEKRAKCAIVHYQDKIEQLGLPRPLFQDVAMSVPALKEIEDLASGEAQSNVVPKVGIGVMLAGMIGTVVIAGCHNLYLVLTHWANIRWAQ